MVGTQPQTFLPTLLSLILMPLPAGVERGEIVQNKRIFRRVVQSVFVLLFTAAVIASLRFNGSQTCSRQRALGTGGFFTNGAQLASLLRDSGCQLIRGLRLIQIL